MGRELLHCRALIKAEQVDLIVHASESVRALSQSRCGRKSALRDEEAFLSAHILGAKHFDKAIH